MAAWILKTEPSTYAFSELVAERKTLWTGVRNFAARLHLRAMKKGDLVLIFHTGAEKALVGFGRVAGPPLADPTAPGEDWTAVPVSAGKALATPLPLAAFKKEKALAAMAMLRQSRLSVSPVTDLELKVILKLAGERSTR